MSALSGKRVLVTRPRAQSGALIERLSSLGAIPVVCPTIQIAPLHDYTKLDRAIQELSAYHWVIFTSANGVSAFWQRLEQLGLRSDALQNVQVAAIGPATARALLEKGVLPSFVPGEFVAEAIIPGLGDVRGQRILLPRADIARRALREALEQLGATADEIPVYRTLPSQPDPDTLAELDRGVDFATFTSASTVRFFMRLPGRPALERLQGAVVACIGPITAGAARECGLTVDIVAAEYTTDGLVDALLEYCQRRI